MKLAQELGYVVEEDVITSDALKIADEIFITGTAVEVTAIGKIDDHVYSVGPVTRHLRSAYENLVRGKPPIVIPAPREYSRYP